MYGMISSWSTHEKLTCTSIWKITRLSRYKVVAKLLFFYCHRWFLPTNYKYRKNRNEFFIGKVERDVVPPLPLSEELYDVVS
jgi:hypothetical protein